MDRARTSRRSFLASCAAAAAFAAGESAATEETSGRIKKAVKYYMVQEGNGLAEKMKIVRDLGFDGIELDSPNNFRLEEVQKARDESGLPIIGVVDSVHWGEPLSSPDPAVQERGREGLKRAIDDAKAYGATSVLLVPAVVHQHVTYEEAWKRSQENIRRMLPHAQSQGVKIAIENVWNKFLLSPLEFARYIDEFDSPWIGAHFDIGNVVEFGFPQHWIRTLGPRVLKLDVKEYGFRNRFDYKLGEGDVDWKAVREALAAIGYKGWATAEIPAGNRAYLADVARRMNAILGISG